jgi:hypothetical protein
MDNLFCLGPVEFLDLSFPRERVPETTFVVGLLAIKDHPD